MKRFLILCICLLVFDVTKGQETPPPAKPVVPPGVEVLKLKWESVTVPARTIIASGASGSQPGTVRQSPGDLTPAAEARRTGNISATVPRGGGVIPPTPSVPSIGPMRKAFVYSLKLENTGKQDITGVMWTYFLLDATDETKVLGRHVFINYKVIKSGENGELKMQTAIRPANLSDQKPEKYKRSSFTERVVVGCVLYVDGTAWRNLSVPKSDCLDFMREGQKIAPN